MISRRIIANLVVFVVLFAVLCLWAVRNVIRFDAIERPIEVVAEFESSPGLRPNFEVAYLGLRVGNIGTVRLVGDHVEVELKIDRDQRLPAAVDAAVRRKSAVGEPYVDLTPVDAEADGPRLRDGDVIPLERTSVPLSYGQLFRSLADLVEGLPPDDVATLLEETALALEGRGEDLRSLLVDSGDIAATVAEDPDLVPRIVDELSRFTHTLAGRADSIGRGLDNLASLSATLAENRDAVVAILDRGTDFVDLADRIVVGTSGELTCTLSGLGELAGALSSADHLDELSRTLDLAQEVVDVFEAVRYTDPSGRTWIDATFQFADGSGEPVQSYVPPHTLPDPGGVPHCTQEDVRRLAGIDGTEPPGDAGSPATTEAGPSPPDDVAAPAPNRPEVPASTDEPVDNRTLLDHLGTAIAALIAAAVVGTLVYTRPWRRLRRGG